jgi:transcriptional regulator with XRE-family HTH domain
MDLPDLRSALIGKIQELDITQREAAEVIGVSQQALSSWVSGDSIPSRGQSPRLAKWLDLPEEAVRRMRLKAAENQHDHIVAERLDHIEEQIEDLRRGQNLIIHTALQILPAITDGVLRSDAAEGLDELVEDLRNMRRDGR